MVKDSDNPLMAIRDAIWRPTSASIRLLALLGVIVNAGIIVTGGAVRLTKSGLGCPTWPTCTGDSLVPTAHPHHSPVNMSIEFGNRLLSFVLLAVGVAVFIAALRLEPRRRDLVRLAALQPLGVVAQAIIGGVTVLVGLHPAAVIAHYMASIVVLFAAVALQVRAAEGDQPARPLVSARLRGSAVALVVVVVALLVAGTVVTGTGPHAGDSSAPRFGFDLEQVTRVHAVLGWVTVLLTVALLVGLRRTGAPEPLGRRTTELLVLELAQGAIGYTQYFLEVPALLVILHMLGSALLWVAALRMLFALRDRGPLVPSAGTPAAAPAASN